MQLGSIGVWSGALRRGGPEMYAAAAELEDMGYSTLWFPGGGHEDIREHIQKMLAATRRAVIATGIISIWTHPATATAAMHAELTQTYPNRFLLGIGISHPNVVQSAGLTYEKPLARLRRYLDE